jgi:hypothetical protein
VAFDPNGDLVFTGILNDDGSSSITHGSPGLLNQDLLLGRMKPTVAHITANPTYAFAIDDAGPYLWYVDDRTPDHNRIGDWTATGLVVLPDGSTIVTGAAYDPAAPNNPPLSMPTSGVDVHMTHFVAGDNFTSTADRSSTDPLANGDPENTFGGSGTDLGLAVALDPTNPNNVYVVGVTNSSDLPTSPGVLQPTHGGGTTTGFVGQVSVA